VSWTLEVLGACGAYPEPGRACSGFVLEHAGFRAVLDLGYGTFSRLAEPERADAVVISHAHPDHMVDLHALFRLRRFSLPDAPRLPLLAPRAVLERLAGLDDDGGLEDVFDWRPLPAPPQPLGPWRVSSFELPHWIPNAGVRLQAPGAVVAYTGDSGPSPALAELGRDADLLIADATGRPGDGSGMDMTPAQAGEAAAAAGARRLLLTHFWPGSDRAAAVRAARERFPGEVLAAEEGLRVAR
jgi:ribonuclease BN (tRNA processing enzyme)